MWYDIVYRLPPIGCCLLLVASLWIQPQQAVSLGRASVYKCHTHRLSVLPCIIVINSQTLVWPFTREYVIGKQFVYLCTCHGQLRSPYKTTFETIFYPNECVIVAVDCTKFGTLCWGIVIYLFYFMEVKFTHVPKHAIKVYWRDGWEAPRILYSDRKWSLSCLSDYRLITEWMEVRFLPQSEI
jgi:hypothetical protein